MDCQILTSRPISGINRKLQLRPLTWNVSVQADGEVREVVTSAQVILKWGGEITDAGIEVSEVSDDYLAE